MGEYVKIGQSSNPERRRRGLDNGPLIPVLIHRIRSDNAIAIEGVLHRRFNSKRVRREWFSLSEEDVAEIMAVTRADSTTDLPDTLRGHTISQDGDRIERIRAVLDIREKAGERLRCLRLRARMSQTQLAEKSGLAVQSVRAYERGRFMYDNAAAKLADALNVDILDIAGAIL